MVGADTDLWSCLNPGGFGLVGKGCARGEAAPSFSFLITAPLPFSGCRIASLAELSGIGTMVK